MLFLLLLTAVLAYLIARQWTTRAKLPPGPIPFPLIGNVPQIVFAAYKEGGLVPSFQYFQKTYGKVFTLWMGPFPSVHIADYEVAQEVMVKRGAKYADRFDIEIVSHFRNDRGLVITNGPYWQEHRRFALHTLRNFGLGKNLMETKIMDEFHKRFEEMDEDSKLTNGETDAQKLLDLLVGSVINQLLFSERFTKETEDELVYLKKLLEDLENTTVFDIVIPIWVMKLPFLRWRYEYIAKPMNKSKEFIQIRIDRKLKELEKGSRVLTEEGEDFTEAYLYRMNAESGKESLFDMEGLRIDLLDLWMAGQETTATTLMWAVVLLLNNPKEEETIREEVVMVTGGRRDLSLNDKANTPYLNAALTEIQRIASIVNLNLWRSNNEDTVIDGHPVCKGVMISAQLSLILADESIFKNPKQFNPSRFLGPERLDQCVISFGLGKRACLGEALARAELYLIVGNMLLWYKLKATGPIPKAETTAPNGLINRPPRCNVVFEKISH